MTLYENWLGKAYTPKGESIESTWKDYLPKEQIIYEEIILKQKPIKGTVKELAEHYNMMIEYMAGFIDGINETILKPVDIKEIQEDTYIEIEVDLKTLYKKMIEYKAKHLYELPQWEEVFSKKELEKYYQEQKTSKTIINPAKIGRNDPCPCGNGKKYKKCCGAN